MFQERNKSCGGADELFRGDVHILNIFARTLGRLAHQTGHHGRVDEIVVFVERSVCLRDHEMLFLVGGKIINLIGDMAVFHAAVRGFEETEFVDLRIERERRNKADVRTFRSFNRADTSVMAVVNVADFKSCAFAAQTAGSESGETALVGQLGKRVDLIHELRKL